MQISERNVKYMKVKECMCENVCCVRPETKLNEIAKTMEKNQIGCVPVCDNSNCIVGLITDRDIILRGIASDKDVKTTTASDIMSCNVCTCNKDDEVYNVEKKMAKNQVRRIPVVENNKVVGILTLGDLAKYNKETNGEHFCNTFVDICECTGKNDQ